MKQIISLMLCAVLIIGVWAASSAEETESTADSQASSQEQAESA